MKIAFAGKGGVGKTTLCSWLGDYLARCGKDVVLVDADTALSLGAACGLPTEKLPVALSQREDLVRERIGGNGMLSLNPDVSDLPNELGVDLPLGAGPVYADEPGRKRLIVMGSIAGAGDGCACAANALLKSLLAHLVLEGKTHVLVDLEAGVEHLGRGTVSDVDGLIVVSEPSLRSLKTAASVGSLAADLGLKRQVLALNRANGAATLPELEGLPDRTLVIPLLQTLAERQMHRADVIGLEDTSHIDALCGKLVDIL